VLLIRPYRPLLARLLLGLFVAIVVNGMVFRHAHRLADGTIITHAHPYNPFGKSPISSNPHSRHELVTLDLFSNTIFTALDAFLTLAGPTGILLLITLLFAPTLRVRDVFGVSPLNRGPPAGLVDVIRMPLAEANGNG
jgi:hypothetical protein